MVSHLSAYVFRIASYLASKVAFLGYGMSVCMLMGYSRKKTKQGGLRIYFSENPPWKFSICDFTLRKSRENKFLPLEIQQNFVTPLGNSKFKNQDPWKFHEFLLEHPWKFCFFFNWPLEFPYFLSSIPREIPCPQPPLVGSFLE